MLVQELWSAHPDLNGDRKGYGLPSLTRLDDARISGQSRLYLLFCFRGHLTSPLLLHSEGHSSWMSVLVSP